MSINGLVSQGPATKKKYSWSYATWVYIRSTPRALSKSFFVQQNTRWKAEKTKTKQQTSEDKFYQSPQSFLPRQISVAAFLNASWEGRWTLLPGGTPPGRPKTNELLGGRSMSSEKEVFMSCDINIVCQIDPNRMLCFCILYVCLRVVCFFLLSSTYWFVLNNEKSCNWFSLPSRLSPPTDSKSQLQRSARLPQIRRIGSPSVGSRDRAFWEAD